MEEIVHDGNDGACSDCCEYDVVVDADPMVSVRRAMQSIVAVVVNDVARRAVRGR